MALLKKLFVTNRTGNEGKLALIVALALICVPTALATVSDQFRFYKTNANGARKKVLFGKSLVINCTTNDPTAYTNLYFKSLSEDHFQIFKYDKVDRVKDVFIIKDFSFRTSGWYLCNSTNRNQETITWQDPSTYVGPAEPHIPKAEISTKNKTLDVGDNFNLSCTSKNVDNVKWFKVTGESNNPIAESRLIKDEKGESKTVTLMIINAQIVDSGSYICEASYEDKIGTKGAHIEVLEPTPPLPTNYSGITNAVVVRSPSKIKIYCDYQGYPLPKIKWYKGTQEIQGCIKSTYHKRSYQRCKNSRIILEYRKESKHGILRGSLTILKTKYSDHGNYVCQASNKKGNNSIAIPVNVETRARLLVDPKNQNIITDLGKSINITCKATGRPQPIVFLSKTNSLKALKYGKGTVTLSIQAVTRKDMGNYSCNATNFYSDLKFFALSELKSTNPQPPEARDVRLKSQNLIIIVVCVVVILFIFVAISIFFYRRQKMLSNKYSLGPEIADYQIDPDRSLLEQCRNLPYDIDWEFPEERLVLGEILGSGAFGLVLQAEAIGIQALRPRDKSAEAIQLRANLRQKSKLIKKKIKKGRSDSITSAKQTVAVKTLKEGATKADYTDLASELKILIHVGEHKNIVNILGACTRGRRLMVIIEFAPHGNLLAFLRERRDIYEPNWAKASHNPGQELTLVDLIVMAHSISQGMEFLFSRKCVHRDLAARNILVGQDYVIKISDFGLARDIYQEDLYVKTSRGLLPIKWMALESLFDRIYTHMSDVWSFGIVLWEIFTLGGTPYPTVPIEQLMDFLTQGQRMMQPNHCPTDLYDLMRQCWEYSPEDRPTFVEISYRLEQIFKDNVSEDTLGYLLLNGKDAAESINCCSELPLSDESNMEAKGETPGDGSKSKPNSPASSNQSPPSSITNNNEYISGTLKREKHVEHKPLLNHESTV
ncbi:fibroblast growth factor receptor 4 [Exaiptasia diaphana]|uniref:Receptor protein-tyrosine kinase n=1 Tax=Exaiptasia diaphana TaxID=2652724 RepID=A0A913XUF3_EXADI|nr:fibroblast growth factor receptor 4 [Exaiptasia diaphana]KXJ28420.1 Fibroblast growth factor receptor 3 [Exaiptasia diaphana]